MKKIWLHRAYLLLVYGFLYSPLLVLVTYSFNQSRYSMLWKGFTWQWYLELFHDTSLWLAAWNSLCLGALSATFATILGMLTAVSLYRYAFKGKGVINSLVFILILSPEIVSGASLLILFSYFLQWHLGFWTLLFSHIAFCVPFVIVTIYARLVTLDKNIFEAAKDLGASDAQLLRKIIVPLLMPALIAAWLLSFTLSLDDVIISYFVAGPEFEILPLKIYAMVRSGIKPEINALCSVLFIATLLLTLLAERALKKRP